MAQLLPVRIPPPDRDFLTDIIPGNTVTIDLFEPASKKGSSTLRIRKVVHGYKNLFKRPSEESFGESGDCNKNIKCYPNWDKQSDAVAMVLLSNGDELCSGALLNNTAQNFRPFFLSAFHCIDYESPHDELSDSEIRDAENWMFKFQYKVTECNGNTVRISYTYKKANFRAAWYNTDFALMELKNSPLENDEITWLGWDRRGYVPSDVTCIHHPAGDVMKISIDNESPAITSITNTTGSHWHIDDWKVGTTQGGSSGSPLLDNNQRVVGQDHAGDCIYCDPCDDIKGTYFGRFSRSWTGGGTPATQLKHWLDPINSGAQTLNTVRSPVITGPNPACASNATYSLNNLPSDATVTWSHSSNFSYVSGQGTDSYQLEVTGHSVAGPDWVKASISVGDFTASIQKDVYLNPPSSDLSIEVPYEPLGGDADFVAWGAGVACGITNYNWSVEGGFIKEDNNDEIIITPTCCKNHLKSPELNPYPPDPFIKLTASASNGCGSYYATRYISIDCDYGGVNPYNIYPNPADDQFTVTMKDDETSTAGSEGNEIQGEQPIQYAYYLYDMHYQLVREIKTCQKKVQIKTNNLEEGFYFLKIVRGKKVWNKKIEVRH
jgi:hypothetical protein